VLRSVVVVGASIAGLKACEGLRHGGFDGSVTLVGAEPHLPYDRPPLSKEFLAGTFTEDRLALIAPAKLAALELELVLGERARSVDLSDRALMLESGRRLAFDGLVVATGAAPRSLPGTQVDGVLTLRGLEDARRLKAELAVGGVRLVVVGGGFLGMEVAATARGLGAEVTVVEPQATPLARVAGPLIGRTIAEIHADHGVDLRVGVGVAGLVVPAGGKFAACPVARAGSQGLAPSPPRPPAGKRPPKGTTASSPAIISLGTMLQDFETTIIV